MSILKFSDGMHFDTGGPMRISLRADGYYVIGEGTLFPARNLEEAKQILKNLENNDVYSALAKTQKEG